MASLRSRFRRARPVRPELGQPIYADVTRRDFGPLVLWQPEVSSIDPRVVALSLLCGWLLLRCHWDIFRVLALSSLSALALALLS